MQQSSNRTPCRRLGLTRVSSASKMKGSTPTSVLSFQSSTPPNIECDNVTPSRSSRTGQSKEQSLARSVAENIHNKSVAKKKNLNKEFGKNSCSGTVLSVSKEEENKSSQSSTDSDVIPNMNTLKRPRLSLVVTPPTMADVCALRKRVALKEKQLKELSQSEIYRKKHDPEQLEKSVQQWMQACQGALEQLQEAIRLQGNALDMNELLIQLGIPAELVKYNIEAQEFE